MFRHTFDVGSDSLIIISSQRVSNILLDRIFKFIQFVRYDFNQNIHGSSAYNFNNAKPNDVVSATKDFVTYLKIFLEQVVDTGNKFFPFESNSNLGESIDILSLISISGNEVLKNEDLIADFSKLLKPFIVDFVFEILKTESYTDLVVYFHDISRADEKANWKATFEVGNEKQISRNIQNASISMSYNSLNLNKSKVFGFSDNPAKIFPLFIILQSTTSIKSKVLGCVIGSMDKVHDIEKFIKNSKHDCLIIDGELDEYYFWV